MFVLTAVLQTLSGGYLKDPVYYVFSYYRIRTHTSELSVSGAVPNTKTVKLGVEGNV